jgi:hypothetical protein
MRELPSRGLPSSRSPYTKPGQLHLVVSYRFGVSSDALAFTTTPTVSVLKRLATVDALLARKRVLHYATIMNFERKHDQPSLRMSTFE